MPGEAISIVCPSCGARSDNAPAGLVGRNVRCPRCSCTFRVEAAAPEPTVYEAADVAISGFDGDKPSVQYRKDGKLHTIECDFIAGCDGFHGVCRASVRRSSRAPWTSLPGTAS